MYWHFLLEFVIVQNELFHQWWQAAMAQMKQNRTKPWCYHHHVSQMRYGSYAGMQYSSFSKHDASHLNQKVIFWSHPSTKHFSNSRLSTWSLVNCRCAAMFFLERSGFLLATVACTWLFSVLPKVELWTLTLARVKKAFSCLEVTLGSFAISWTITQLLEWHLLEDHSWGR